MPQPSDKPPEASALDPEHFAALVSGYVGGERAIRDLHALLLRTADVPERYEARSAWLEDFGEWLHAPGAGLLGRTTDEERTGRLRGFVLALASVRGFRESFAALFTGVVRELRGTKLFADVGIPIEPGFWREAIDRLSRGLLPAPPAPRSFADFIGRLFPTEADAKWLATSPPETWMKLWTTLEATKTPLSTAWMPLAGSMADAMRILAARIASLGVAQDVRDRLPEVAVSGLPFLRLPQLCEAVQLGPPRLSFSNEGALAMIDECRAALRQVHAHVEEYGVSVDLVYRIELMTAQLARLEQLVALLVPASSEALAGSLGRFALSLVQAQFQGRSVLELLRTSSHLLARKIVERSGKTGEHYITQTRAEWRAMLLSAAGGGFLTTFTAALKFLTGALGLPVFWATAANCVNYAGSFLLMGALGFTLATKQPSMTAAALASSLESEEGRPPSVERLVTLSAQIARSQLAAAIGNVGMVIPTVLAFDWIWRRLTGHVYLNAKQADYVVHSLQPFHGGTVFYAALTGVVLWISSLGAGWLENWVVYRRLPEALAKHRGMKRLLGPERAERFARAVESGAATIGGSTALGVLLGVVPTIGVFFGLPIDVRHVTLSTGSLVFAADALGAPATHHTSFLLAAGAIAVIGSLNFGVSFLCALAVALRARERWRLGAEHVTRDLLRALVRRFFTRPLQFFFPPGSPDTTEPAHGSRRH